MNCKSPTLKGNKAGNSFFYIILLFVKNCLQYNKIQDFQIIIIMLCMLVLNFDNKCIFLCKLIIVFLTLESLDVCIERKPARNTSI